MHRIPRFAVGVITFFVGVFFVSSAQAKEAYFTPAIGEVIPQSVGTERAVVNQNGSLSLYANNGANIVGYPLVQPNTVFVSSPLLVDLTNDGAANEIVVVGRNSQNAYNLYAYVGDKTLLAQASVSTSVQFDPIANGHDVLLITTGGEVLNFSLQNNTFVRTQLFSVNTPGAIAFSLDHKKIYVSILNRAEVWVYTITNGIWARTGTIRLAYALTAPVAQDDVNPDILYGVNSNRQLIAYNQSTSRLVTGFPVTVTSTPVTGPVLTDMVATNSGLEIFIQLSDGSAKILAKNGTFLQTLTKKSFVDTSTGTPDIAQNGIFSTFNNFGINILNNNGKKINSIFSRLRLPAGFRSYTPFFDQVTPITIRPFVVANNQEIQVADFTVHVQDVNHPNIDSLSMLINRSTTNTVDMRGRFLYTPARGFEASAGTYFGNQYVRLIPQNTSNSSAGSQITSSTADGTVHYIFRWTLNSNFGARTNNTISYTLISGTYYGPTILAVPTFTSASGTSFTPFFDQVTPITIRPSVVANNQDIQVADFAIHVLDLNHPNIDSLSMVINRSSTNAADMRGRFLYTPVRGFEASAGTYFGNQYVRLLPQNSTNSSAGSQITTNPIDGTVHYIFRWTLNSNFGARINNTISYTLISGTYYGPTILAVPTFAVTQ